jgi:aspartate/methionine/tyrosine aminotransferase
VVSFALGEPDFTAPKCVIDATVASLQPGDTHDMPNAGTGLPSRDFAICLLQKKAGCFSIARPKVEDSAESK